MLYEHKTFKSCKHRKAKETDVAVFYSKLEFGYAYKYRYSVYSFHSESYVVRVNKATGLKELQRIAKKYDGVIIKCLDLPENQMFIAAEREKKRRPTNG